MKRIIVCLTALFAAVSAYAQFDGAVGTEGCQAISREDSRIKSWAFGIEVQRGIFGADMKIQLLNDGPVTIIMEK